MAAKEVQPVAVSEERNKALKLAIEKIEKDFGKGSIMKLGDKPSVNVEAIPTGSLRWIRAWYRRCSTRKNYRSLRP